MKAIKDLSTLLSSIKPELHPQDYVFISLSQEASEELSCTPLMRFVETEGVTLILTKTDADTHSLSYEDVWALITLSVHSDLNAVGFLAAITTKLAQEGISVNAVSAYYHDHLFVRKRKRTKNTCTS